MIKIYIGDNLSNLDNIKNNSIGICYIDPPYNTGNKFSYEDKIEQEKWIKNIDERIRKVKTKLVKNGVIIFSISEKSLFDAYGILKNNFTFVFEPLIWQTKNVLNQNKITNISAITHEYILIASDKKIKTNNELISDKNLIKEKQKNYQLGIKLKKDIKEYPLIKIKDKNIRIINDYIINKDIETKDSFKKHRFQKRTAQKGHGSYRYIEYTKNIKDYNSKNLFYIEGVKDKQGLGGKFILGNSYFQSIGDKIELKIPSLLGFYQAGISGFQTAKPITLIKRLIKAFDIYEDLPIIDLYSGSGNVIKAIIEEGKSGYGFELGGIDNKSINVLKENLKEYKNISYI